MSAKQGAAIKAWWAKRFESGLAKRRDLERRKVIQRLGARKRREKHRERDNETAMRCYRKNRAAILERRRAVYAQRVELMRAKDRKRRADNKELFSERDRARYPSRRDAKMAAIRVWRDKNREHVRECNRRRDALKMATRVGPVDYLAVLEKSNGLCGICDGAVDRTNRKSYHFDHIVPLARGGAHVQENIQLAHAMCNIKKNAKVA